MSPERRLLYSTQQGYLISYAGGTLTIDPAALAISAVADSKTYDGTTSSTKRPSFQVTGLAADMLYGSDYFALLEQVFYSPNAQGAGNSTLAVAYSLHDGNDGANYSITTYTAAGTINPAALTITGLAANSKSYDGTTSATLSGTPVLGGFVGADTGSVTGTPTANFVTANAGTGIAVTVSGYGFTLTTGTASNYTLTQPTLAADIEAASLTITAVSDSKTYDGTTASSQTPTYQVAGLAADMLYGGDGFTALSQAFQSANALGAGNSTLVASYVLSDPGNYSVTTYTATGTISPASLTITGISANDKPYDGTTAATLSGTPVLNGLVSPDAGSVTGTPVANFTTAAAGSGIAVTVTGYGFSLTSGLASNYTLTQPALVADITAASLTVTGITVNTKTYDGTTTATLNFSGAALSQTVANVSLDTSGYIASFAAANAGIGIAVTVSGLTLQGSAASGYSLVQPTGLTGTINAATLTITGVTANNKLYDGTTAATLSGAPVLSGLVGTDAGSVTGTPSATFASAGLGTGITVDVAGYGFSLTSGLASNYMLVQPTLSANITAAGSGTLTVSGLTVNTKVYNGTTTATLNFTDAQLDENGDPVSIPNVSLATTGYTANFATAGAGSGIAVTVSRLKLQGSAASSYTLVQPTGLTGTITPAQLTLTGLIVVGKVYDGTTAATLGGTLGVAGLVGTDTVAVSLGTLSASYVSPSTGTEIEMILSGLPLLSGPQAGDYAVTPPKFLFGAIYPRPLTVSGITVAEKIYNGNTVATLSFTGAALGAGLYGGIVASDQVTLNETAYAASFAAVGSRAVTTSDLAVNVTNLYLNGAQAADYYIEGSNTFVPAPSSWMTNEVSTADPFTGLVGTILP